MGFLRTGIKDGIISVLTEDDIAVPDGVADSTARLALRGFPRGARVYQTDNGFWYELTNAAAPSDVASWQAQPKVYKALLTQASTGAPTAVVLENTLAAAIVWSYVDVGSYLGTLAGAFPANTVFSQPVYVGDPHSNILFGSISRATDNTVTLLVGNPSSQEALNDVLAGSPFAIEVYPA